MKIFHTHFNLIKTNQKSSRNAPKDIWTAVYPISFRSKYSDFLFYFYPLKYMKYTILYGKTVNQQSIKPYY